MFGTASLLEAGLPVVDWRLSATHQLVDQPYNTFS
jgi:hypothetical protein